MNGLETKFAEKFANVKYLLYLCVGFQKTKSMKKLLCFVCFGLLMLTATAAQPTRAVAQMQSDAVVLTDYAQPDFVDFVIVSYDMGVDATTPEETHVYYDAPFADCNVPVFDISLPVFRLCGELCALSICISRMNTGRGTAVVRIIERTNWSGIVLTALFSYTRDLFGTYRTNRASTQLNCTSIDYAKGI